MAMASCKDVNAMGSLIGLKIEISPEILLSRDADGICGSKIFTLIPPHIRTVRELKNHLSSNVLRTSSPFYFYNGDYRILDEDDVRIFSILTEPCRILPVPRPRSVLSVSTSLPTICSTPISSESNILTPKRVKFSDELFSCSPRGSVKNGLSITTVDPDQVDAAYATSNLNGSINHAFSSLTAFSPAPGLVYSNVKAKKMDIKLQNDQAGISESSQKKRRRRHKSKRKDKVAVETTTSFESEDRRNRINFLEKIGDDKLQDGPSTSKRRKTQALQAYDADESELDPSQNQQSSSENIDLSDSLKSNSESQVKPMNKEGKKIFLSPKTAFSETGYTRLRKSSCEMVTGLSNSIPSGYGSPVATSTRKRRQDTPNLPRVLKNPCSAYEIVKKSLNARLDQAAEFGLEESKKQEHLSGTGTVTIELNGSSEVEIKNGETTTKERGHEEFYQNLPVVDGVTEIKVGTVIAFKIVELDENYVPCVSSYKEARVIAKDGSLLILEYLKNVVKERSGAFEIQDDDIETESLDCQPQINFGELIEPKILEY